MTEPPTPEANKPPIRDFTLKRGPYEFRIDDDVFRAPAKLSVSRIKRVANLASSMGQISVDTDLGALTDTVASIYRLLLPGASGERFATRLMAGSGEEDETDEASEIVPIDLLGEALPVLWGILEHYGMRPTKPSQPLSDGLMAETTGIPSESDFSTDGASPEESTSENSASLTT